MNDADLRIELARLDERVKALVNDIDRTEIHATHALKIASDELARRLDVLNHAHEEARSVLGTYIPRELADRAFKEIDLRIRTLEDAQKELQGRLWLPMIIVAAIAAGLTAAAVKLLVP